MVCICLYWYSVRTVALQKDSFFLSLCLVIMFVQCHNKPQTDNLSWCVVSIKSDSTAWSGVKLVLRQNRSRFHCEREHSLVMFRAELRFILIWSAEILAFKNLKTSFHEQLHLVNIQLIRFSCAPLHLLHDFNCVFVPLGFFFFCRTLSPHTSHLFPPLCDGYCQQLLQLHSSGTKYRMFSRYLSTPLQYIICPKADLLITVLSSNKASEEWVWSAVCVCRLCGCKLSYLL